MTGNFRSNDACRSWRALLILIAFGMGAPTGARAGAPEGASGSRYAVAPSAFEHGDSGRSGVFASACGRRCWQAPRVRIRRAATRFAGAYNLATDPAGDLYVLEGVAPAVGVTVPMVTKVARRTLRVVWRARLDPARLPWIYPGVVTVHANGFVYAVTGRIAAKIDPANGKILSRTVLPGGAAPNDAAYNGVIVLADGRLLAKSFSRLPGCRAEGFQAFLECGSAAALGSLLVVLDPAKLDILSVMPAPERIGGRVSALTRNGREYVYLPGQTNVHRLIYREGVLAADPSWVPPRYRPDGERPGTAVVAFGDWIVVQTNARYTENAATLTAFHQDDPARRHSIRPFAAESPGASFIPSKPTTDWANRRVYVVDGFGGSAALDFDPDRGFSVAWRAPERSLNFTTLLGAPDDRLLVTTAIETAGADLPAMRYPAERVTIRDPRTGRIIAQTSPLPPGPGLNQLPGRGTVLYYLSIEGQLFEIRPGATR